MKAQVSIEFIAFLGIILFIFALASFSSISASKDIASSNEVTHARRLATNIAQEINIAFEIGEGYTRTFNLPTLFPDGSNYTVNTSQTRLIQIHWKNKTYSLPIFSENITGTIKKGSNTMKNINGVISFE